MKFFLLIVIIACTIYSNVALKPKIKLSDKLRISSAAMKCGKLNNVNYGDIKAKGLLAYRKYLQDPEPNHKCFLACLYKKLAGFKDNKIDKVFVEKTLSRMIGPQNAKQAVQQCQDVTDEDSCVAAHKSFLCFDEQIYPMVKSKKIKFQ